MLNEPAVALRTKAVKALTSIVTVDPNILERVRKHYIVCCRFSHWNRRYFHHLLISIVNSLVNLFLKQVLLKYI